MSNLYLLLKERQQEQFNKFPMFFAFDKKQLEEGKQKLGVKDNKEICKFCSGGFIRKADKQAFLNMILRQDTELKQAIANDKTGEGFIHDMFLYELANHEYCITYEIDDTLDAVNLTLDEVKSSKALKNGLELAKKNYLESII